MVLNFEASAEVQMKRLQVDVSNQTKIGYDQNMVQRKQIVYHKQSKHVVRTYKCDGRLKTINAELSVTEVTRQTTMCMQAL